MYSIPCVPDQLASGIYAEPCRAFPCPLASTSTVMLKLVSLFFISPRKTESCQTTL
jgi:hypothetical protein